jgi:glycosyltransferase involved in cell wall biosynthesis
MGAPGPLVSVLMPVHNAVPYLAAAIDSVLRQTHGALELVVKDDGSTDRSPAIAQAWAARDGRVRLLPANAENRGEAAARTELLAAAQGEVVAWMDADDLSEPERLERQLRFLDAHPEIAAVGTGIIDTDAALNPTGARRFPADPELQATSPDLLCATLMVRAAAARAVGPFRSFFQPGGCDGDWVLRLCDRHRLTNIPDLLYRYRHHAGGMSRHAPAIRRLGVLARQAARLRRQGRPDPIEGLAFDPALPYLADAVFLADDGLPLEERLLALGLPLPDRPRLVTVLLPFRDQHRYLDAALASLARQSFPNLSVVILDNASDHPLDAAQLAERHPTLAVAVLRTRRRLRGSRLLRRLVKAATGPLVLWHQASDISRSDRVLLQIRNLLAEPGRVAVGSGVNLLPAGGGPALRSLSFPSAAVRDGRVEAAPHSFLMWRDMALGGLGWRPSRTSPLEDGRLLRRAAQRGQVVNLADFLVDSREAAGEGQRGDSGTN